MTKESQDKYSNEEQMKKIMAFTQKQQDKATELIEKTKNNMTSFAAFKQANDINEQTDALMKSVNEKLDKAMAEVNRQMDLITTQ